MTRPEAKTPAPFELLDWGVLAVVVMAGLVAMSLNVADPDLWGHIQYGRDAIAGGLPATTTYSYLAQGYPWINHEILAEFTLAIVNDTGGGTLLLVSKALAALFVLLCVVRACRKQNAGLVVTCAITLLVAVGLGNHWSLRPQLFSYVFFAAMLVILDIAFAGWDFRFDLFVKHVRSRWSSGKLLEPTADEATSPLTLNYSSLRLRLLWLMPPLMVAWTNAHGGFLAGLCVLIAILCLRGAEAVVVKGRAANGLLLRFGLMIVASCTATLLNPYGPGFHQWLYDDLKVPRPEIVEWRAPDFTDPQMFPFILLIGVWGVCLLASPARRDWTIQIVLALILWQALTHLRHASFFTIAVGLWLPGLLQAACARIGIGSDETSISASMNRWSRVALAAGVAVAMLICGSQLATRLTNLRVQKDVFPVSAVEFISREGLTGRMVCTFNWAQYLLAATGPAPGRSDGILVQVDGRCRTSYSQEMLDMHFDFILGPSSPDERFRDPASGPYDPARSLKEGHPDLVLIQRSQEPSVDVMQAHSRDWVLLYQDELAQLWGRKARYDLAASPYYLAPHRRMVSSEKQTGDHPWPAIFPYRQAAAGQLAVTPGQSQ